jgi:subtilisin family serine protease
MSKVTDAVRSVTVDRRVTQQEWEEALAPLARALPLRASEDTRALLELWGDSRFELEPETRMALAKVLIARGYPVADDGTVPAAGAVARAIAENVTETDAAFERLSRAVERESAEELVAVLDNGMDVTHPAFEGKLWEHGEIAGNDIDDDGNGFVDDVVGWDFAGNDNDLSNEGLVWYHGTHVSGIATRGSDRVKGLLVRLGEAHSTKMLLDAFDYAIQGGARVINMSIGVVTPDRVRKVKAYIEAHPDVLFVKSAGNDSARLGVPGGGRTAEETLSANVLPNLLVVANATPQGGRSFTSNYGLPYTDVAMRGVDVFSAFPGALYKDESGTSMATPHASNLAAKCRALHPDLKPEALKELFVLSADPHPDWKGRVRSKGTVNAERAMTVAALARWIQAEDVTPEAAATHLGLTGPARDKVLGIYAELVTRGLLSAEDPATT